MYKRKIGYKMKEKTKKITKKTKLSKIISKNPDVVEILFNAGLTCVGCPMAMQETLEQGCKTHGMSGKDVDKLVDKLNKNSK